MSVVFEFFLLTMKDAFNKKNVTFTTFILQTEMRKREK